MKPTLLPDGRMLLAGHRLDATAVDQLIRDIAEARAGMEPPVPRAWAPTDELGVVSDPAMRVGLVKDASAPQGAPRLLIALRHEGLGWCCFDFDLEAAAHLRDFIAKRTTGIPVGGLDDAQPIGGVQ